MIGSRLILLSLVVSAFAAGSAQAGLFTRKPKPDSQQAKPLIESLRSDPQESKRLEALKELEEHDPKSNLELLAAMIGAVQRDPSETVRAAAAVVLGRIKPYSAQAGLVLERAAEGDRSAKVRDAARESLWEYHLNGYRGQFVLERMSFQTAEPPLARPSVIKPTAMVMPTVEFRPPGPSTLEPSAPRLPPTPVSVGILPPLVAPPGPIKSTEVTDASQRLLIRPTFPLNRTDEPPLARRRAAAIGTP